MEKASVEIQRVADMDDKSSAERREELATAVIGQLSYFRRIAFRRLKNMADAEDAVQDALVLAWENVNQFRGESRISTWLIAIVKNSARARLRKSSSRVHLSLDDREIEGRTALSETLSDSRSSPEELCQRWEMVERAVQISRTLSPGTRQVFQLRDLRGMNIEEAARVLGAKKGTVRVRSIRARAAIRQLLEGRRTKPASL